MSTMMYSNLDTYYPEFENDDFREKYHKHGRLHHCHFYGIIKDKSKATELARLTHHAEGLYDETEFENVHVEVRLNGKWYGR